MKQKKGGRGNDKRAGGSGKEPDALKNKSNKNFFNIKRILKFTAWLFPTIGFIFSLRPIIKAEPICLLDVNAPFTNFLKVSNLGKVPVVDIKYTILAKSIGINGSHVKSDSPNSGFYLNDLEHPVVKQLSPGKSAPFGKEITEIMPGALDKAEVGFQIYYSLPFIPYEFSTFFNYSLYRTSDGKLTWIEVP